MTKKTKLKKFHLALFVSGLLVRARAPPYPNILNYPLHPMLGPTESLINVRIFKFNFGIQPQQRARKF